MLINFFSGLIILFILLSLLFWLLYYNPIRKIKNSLMNTAKSLNRELKVQGNAVFFMQNGYRMFRNRKLSDIWNEYLTSEFVKKGMFQYSNINEFFSEENIIGRLVNTSFSSSIPMVLFAIGIILSAVYSLYHAYRALLSDQIALQTAVLILISALISLFMFI